MILDIFKPAWQSTNSNRRRKSVQKLNPDITDEADVLYSLASSDPEQSVRLAAIERISNITLLARLLKNAPTSLEQDKLGRLVAQSVLLEQTDLEGIQKAISLIDMDDDLVQIALEAKSSDAQMQAAVKIRDEAALAQIATQHLLSKLRLGAAQRITHPTLLNQLLESAKGKDKSVWRVAKEKLDLMRQEEQSIAKHRAAADECFLQMKLMQNQDIDTLFRQKWLLLQSQWSEIAHSEKDHIDIKDVISNVATRLEAFEARSAEEAFQVASRAEAQLEQAHTLSLLSEALDILKNTETQDIDMPSLRATLTTQKSRWQIALEVCEPQPHQAATFARDSQKLSQAIDAIYTLRKHLSAIQSIHQELHQLSSDDLVSNGELYDKTKQLIAKIKWPKDVIVPKDLQRLHTDFQCLEDRQNRQLEILKQHKQHITQLMQRLEEAIAGGQLSDTDLAMKEVQLAIKKIPAHAAEPFKNKMKPLHAQYVELKDWQAFAAQPKKEALIISMEGLAQDTPKDVDPSVRLEYIQKLQAEWKGLGRLSPVIEKQLWDKFQAASKTAYQPCKSFYEAKANTRVRNKLYREKMCKQLTDYLEKYNWAKADWQCVQETIKLAREEWKRYLPVDRKYHKPLEEQFEGLLNQLNVRLQAHKKSNERIKQKLLDQAIVLQEHQELDSAMIQMRQLRDEWRKIGLLPSESYKKMNQAFYDAYTMLNERKKKQWSDVNSQKAHNAEQITSILDQLEQMQVNEDLKIQATAVQELVHVEQAFDEFKPLHEQDQKKLYQRFTALSKQMKGIQKNAHVLLKQQTIATLWHRSEILRKLELKVMQSTLDQSILQELTEQWRQIPETNHHAIATLNARFDAAIEAFSTRDMTSMQQISIKADKYANELCILMEILAEITSPEQESELRMQLQVNRLNQSLQTRGDSQELQFSEADSLYLEWCNTGPLSSQASIRLEQRFSHAKAEYSP